MSELEKRISREMGWWSPDGFDAYPDKTAKVITLIADIVREIVPEKAPTHVNQVAPGDNYFTEGWNAAISRMQENAGKLGVDNELL